MTTEHCNICEHIFVMHVILWYFEAQNVGSTRFFPTVYFTAVNNANFPPMGLINGSYLIYLFDKCWYLLRFDEFELHASASPRDEVWVGRVVQQGHQKLPELQGAAPLIRRALAIQPCLLLYVTCTKPNDQSGQSIIKSANTLMALHLSLRRHPADQGGAKQAHTLSHMVQNL